MNKTKITLQIESKKERRASKLEKFINAFVRMTGNLPRRDKAELSRLIVIVFALVAQTYLLIWILTFVLNRP